MNPKYRFVLERLGRGESFEHREHGNSMRPIISSGQPVTLSPVDAAQLEPGDVVLVMVRGRMLLHLVSAVQANRVQISNNRGHVNGWTSCDRVYAIVTAVDGVPRPSAARKIKR